MRRLPLPPTPPLPLLLLLLLLLLELTVAGGDSALRPPQPGPSPRQIQLTEGATARGELVLWMPLTVVLPSLASQSQHTSPARSQRRLRTEQYEGTAQAPSERRTAYDWTDPEYRAAGAVGPLLSRLDAYFHYLRIPEESCRRRTICQLARQVDAFEPVSGLVLRALREVDVVPGSEAGRPGARRFSLYQTAAGRGLFGADCGSVYGRCGADARQLINMPVLRLWQWLAERLALHITDD